MVWLLWLYNLRLFRLTGWFVGLLLGLWFVLVVWVGCVGLVVALGLVLVVLGCLWFVFCLYVSLRCLLAASLWFITYCGLISLAC